MRTKNKKMEKKKQMEVSVFKFCVHTCSSKLIQTFDLLSNGILNEEGETADGDDVKDPRGEELLRQEEEDAEQEEEEGDEERGKKEEETKK